MSRAQWTEGTGAVGECTAGVAGGGGIQVLYGRCCVVCLPAAWFLGALLSGLNGSNLPRVDAEGKVPLP